MLNIINKPDEIKNSVVNDCNARYNITLFDFLIIGGDWYRGPLEWGVWLDGTFHNGVWSSGNLMYHADSNSVISTVWISGRWKKGSIWNINGKYKVSKVSPKSYFKPNNTLSLNYAKYS